MSVCSKLYYKYLVIECKVGEQVLLVALDTVMTLIFTTIELGRLKDASIARTGWSMFTL